MSQSDNRSRPELTEEILKRRRAVQARMAQRWRRLLLTGAVSGGALAGAAGCESSQVCLSYIPTLMCPANPDDWILMEKARPTATWVQSGHDWHVSVEAEVRLMDQDDPLIFTAGPTLEGATLISETVTDTTLAFAIDPGAAEVRVTVPVDCDSNAQALRFSIDTNHDPVAGGSLPITQITQ